MKGDLDTRSKRQAATKSFQPLATLGHFVFVVRKAAGASRGPSRSRGWPRFARRAAPSLGVWWQLMILMRSGRRRRQLPAARRPCPLGPLGPLSLGGKTRQPRPLAPAGSTGPNSQTPGLGLPEPRSSTDRQEGRASTGVSSRPRCAPETLRVTSPQRRVTQVQTDFPAAGACSPGTGKRNGRMWHQELGGGACAPGQWGAGCSRGRRGPPAVRGPPGGTHRSQVPLGG